MPRPRTVPAGHPNKPSGGPSGSSVPDAAPARRSSLSAGATVCRAIAEAPQIPLGKDLVSFLSYVKSRDIPVLRVNLPDVRTVLGNGTSFIVNGAEMPRPLYSTAPSTAPVQPFPEGKVVALKRAHAGRGKDQAPNTKAAIQFRMTAIYNELLTMRHPPLATHPNIVDLLGVNFAIEGPPGLEVAIPMLVPECASLGNLAELMDFLKKEERTLSVEQKLSVCLDVAYGLDVLHQCNIVHGDVKCENVLVFQRNSPETGIDDASQLYTKLTDFGFSCLSQERFRVARTPPWQAPECSDRDYILIEDAKRTDIYSFGMLLWRVMADGDPFKGLGQVDVLDYEQKQNERYSIITSLKDADDLVDHVCQELQGFSSLDDQLRSQLMAVISRTLNRNSSDRASSLKEIIETLLPGKPYENRSERNIEPIVSEPHVPMLDIELHYSELSQLEPIVQRCIFNEFESIAKREAGARSPSSQAQAANAAYQIALCCAIGFGCPQDDKKCLDWLKTAKRNGHMKATDALPNIRLAVLDKTGRRQDEPRMQDDTIVDIGLAPIAAQISAMSRALEASKQSSNKSPTSFSIDGLLRAAEACDYSEMELILAEPDLPDSVVTGTSEHGVSVLHFFSSWDLERARSITKELLRRGANINALAQHGPSSRGGTPLSWAVYADRLEHVKVLVQEFGADARLGFEVESDALTTAASMHLFSHLDVMLSTATAQPSNELVARLLLCAATGENRFVRLARHGVRWREAALQTLKEIERFSNLRDFRSKLCAAVHDSSLCALGRMNHDVQLMYLQQYQFEPVEMTQLLRNSVSTFNHGLFLKLLDLKVPVDIRLEEGRSLLHICAHISDHWTAATHFAPPLLHHGLEIESRDATGLTPFMFAALERKWELALYFLNEGADMYAEDKDGYNILGLTIKSVNVGAIKFVLNLCDEGLYDKERLFLVNPRKEISAYQQASLLSLPLDYGWRLEVWQEFNLLIQHFDDSTKINFRSSGIDAEASALDIAAKRGHVFQVKRLLQHGATEKTARTALALVESELGQTEQDGAEPPASPGTRLGLRRCKQILGDWHSDNEESRMEARRKADEWTNFRYYWKDSDISLKWQSVGDDKQYYMQYSQDVS